MKNDLVALEAVARAAPQGNWTALVYERSPVRDLVNTPGNSLAQVYRRGAAAHIATFDPPTVLALIERVRVAERVAEAAQTYWDWRHNADDNQEPPPIDKVEASLLAYSAARNARAKGERRSNAQR